MRWKKEKTQPDTLMKKIFNCTASWIIWISISLLILLVFITPALVNGESMEPTLHNMDILFLLRNREVERYDIIAFIPEGESEIYIKRVVAMPGETVYISEDGYLYVNGEKIEDEYTFDPMEYQFNGCRAIMLGPDEYYTLGDNRNYSTDSRVVGPAKEDSIKGVAVFRIFPFTSFGFLD